MTKILVVDDQPEVLAVICDALELGGYEVVACERGSAALGHIGMEPIDLLITDIFMPDIDGLETIRRAWERRPEIPIIAISGARFEQIDYLEIADRFGAAATLRKPFRIAELLELMSRLLATA